jgi:hypothetical protein
VLQTPDHNDVPIAAAATRPRIRFGLSAKLLLLTVLFVTAGLVGWLRNRFAVLRSYIQ